jgi:hypothetical protein
MPIETTCLFIDNRPAQAARLKEQLNAVLSFSDQLVVRSPREGLEIIAEQHFEVCFIASSFPAEDVNAFIRDLAALQLEQKVLLIQVRDGFAAHDVRAELAGERFATVISRDVTTADVEALSSALQWVAKEREVRRRCHENSIMVDLLLRDVSRVSKDIKRGKQRKLTRTSFTSYIRDHIEFSPAVRESYFSELEKRVEHSQPAKDITLKIPERMFALDLPGLSNGTYEGQSLRVWEMLAARFGVSNS